MPDPIRTTITVSTDEQAGLARLRHLLAHPGAALISGDERVPLPASVQTALVQALAILQRDRAVQIVPTGMDLTAPQAARLLGISRPHFISLLNAGELPYYWVGKHRRVRLTDVQTYDAQRRAKGASPT